MTSKRFGTQMMVGVLALGLLAAACGDDDEATPATTVAPTTQAPTTMAPETTEAEMAEMDIVDTAVAAGDFTVLAEALQAAGLVDALKAEGPFTVFAPTDEAFAAALDALGMTKDELFADTELLTSVLTYHVVPGAVLAADVVGMDGESATTLNGAAIDIAVVDGGVVLNGDTNVVTTDILASNGVIHVIDKVLLPPSA